MSAEGRMYPPGPDQEFGVRSEVSPNLVVTGFVDGPFLIVVTDPNNPLDECYPIVVAPEGGYKTKEEAILYIERNFAHRKVPYLALKFTVAPIRSEDSFGVFCSWED